MYRFLEFAIFFVVIMLLQGFLFSNLNLSMYIYPLAYISFVILLPMQTAHVWVLLLGLLTGATADLFTGTPGLNTIATLATAFCRPTILTYTTGKEVVGEGGLPTSHKLGIGKFMRYASVMVLLQCVIYFAFESLGWKYFHLTAVKIICSALVTVGLVYLSQMLLIGNYRKSGIE